MSFDFEDINVVRFLANMFICFLYVWRITLLHHSLQTTLFLSLKKIIFKLSNSITLTLSLSLSPPKKNSLDQTFRKLKKKGEKINTWKLVSLSIVKKFAVTKTNRESGSTKCVRYVHQTNIRHRTRICIGVFSRGFPSETGIVVRLHVNRMQRHVQIWSKTGGEKKKEKMQMHVPERVVRVLVRTFGCITVRFRAWHGRKMSGHSLL